MADLIERRAAYIFLTEYYNHRTELQHKNLEEALSRVPTADIQDKLVDILENMKDDDYYGWIHTQHSILSEDQWDWLIERVKKRLKDG